ncbi:hypothetical protein COOONC_12227 [Cooperia oncophora]
MLCCSCIAVWLTVGSVIAYFLFFRKNKKQVELRKHDWKPDTVYLYQFPRTKTIPNLSPFCLKVETFMKVHKIPYEVCPLMMGRSKNGLLPFVELNGEHIADSQIIINRLKDHFNVKYESKEIHATKTMASISLKTFLAIPRTRTNEFLKMLLRELGCPAAVLPILVRPAAWLLRPKANKRIAAAIGQFPVEDFESFLHKDFSTYRDLLGDKKFFFGDEMSTVSHFSYFYPIVCDVPLRRDSYPSAEGEVPTRKSWLRPSLVSSPNVAPPNSLMVST